MKIYVYNYLETLGKLAPPYYELHQNDVNILNGNSGSEGHYFSDLNGDYYIFKNSKEDIIGKMQYKRWLKNEDGNLFSEQEIEDLLKHNDIILGNPLYCKQSIAADYGMTHPIEDLQKCSEVIELLHGYGTVFDDFVNKFDLLIPGNIYIAKRKVIMNYYKWLFPILGTLTFEIKKDVLAKRDFHQQRAFYYLAERLLQFYFLVVKPKTKIAYAEYNFINFPAL